MSEQPNGDQGTESVTQFGTEETPSRSYGRRALMLGTAAVGAGAAVSFVARPEVAGAESPDAGGKVKLGEANTATATTSISMAVDGDSGIQGIDTSSGGGYGVYGTSESGTGIYGTITGDTRGHFAIEGSDASTGSGGGAGIGGFSTNGTGVFATSTNGTGVTGIHSTGEGTGVAGVDNSGNDLSYGVYGSSATGFGVYGTSPNGVGVSGNGTGAGGVGVEGNSTGSYGVNGNTSGTSFAAVYGMASGEGGPGVLGQAVGEDAHGVHAIASGTGSSYGVYANSNNSDAIYADGSAAVTGTLSKGGGSFKIDHPVDPENKYLYHSFVESPDMMNVYNGTVVLDGDGRATVELAEWFGALNRDYRYQLTAIGAPAPELHVSREVEDGTFSIAGGKADQKVSWQVTGIRQDAWANANRIPVEVDKPEQDRGRYLHPELFGGEVITALAKAREHGRRHRTTSVASTHDRHL